MRQKAKTMILVAITVLAIISMVVPNATRPLASERRGPGQPLPIPEGPMGALNAVAGDPYWFQQGAEGDSSTDNSVGARVDIRTVYDSVNNDAHSYWVGSILANGAFVQVGYLNGLSTTGQYYCCAWFYEFFPPSPQTGYNTSPPIIGLPGSAGAIGSWHTYSMNYTGNGVWSFYMDNQYLGSSPSAGELYYLGSGVCPSGSGPGDCSSGGHAVAALSEVAQTTVNTDVIGPAEFKNFQYETTPNAWNNVPTGKVHWGYGATSSTNLPNPYSVTEIEGVPNDFLTGSKIPYPGSDQCGNSAPYSPNPSLDATLWPVTGLSCLGGTTNSFSFIDENGTTLIPAWISLNNSGKEVFYTDSYYQNYQNLKIPSGQWTLDQISWHSVNVATGEAINSSLANQSFSTRAFSITLAVVGYFYSLPVNTATVILYLPDSTNQTLRTDSNGEAVFVQLPASTYSVHINVPYGIASSQELNITGPGSMVAKVFSLPELLTIIVPPIFLAVLASVLIVRKERQRQAMVQAQAPPMQPMQGPLFCRSCGQPLARTANFCTSCGTPVRMIVP